MSETKPQEKLRVRVARLESTAFKSPIVVNSTQELLELVVEAMRKLDPNDHSRNRITITLRDMDPDEFDKLPDAEMSTMIRE